MKYYVQEARTGFYVYKPHMHRHFPTLLAVKEYLLAMDSYGRFDVEYRGVSEDNRRELVLFEGTMLKGKSIERAVEDYNLKYFSRLQSAR